MRGAVSQAQNLENNASSTAAGFGSGAEDISSTLTPFLTRELTSPGGISQQDQTAMLSASQAGAGGVAGGLETKANERAAATGDSSGGGAALDDIARQREQAAASASSGIANENTQEKLKEQQEGAEGLKGLYGTDVGAQLGALGVQNNAIGQEVNAGSHGWFQNMTNLIASIRGGGQAPGAMPTFGGGGGNLATLQGGAGMPGIDDSEGEEEDLEGIGG
jgi:hypothetical protein